MNASFPQQVVVVVSVGGDLKVEGEGSGGKGGGSDAREDQKEGR